MIDWDGHGYTPFDTLARYDALAEVLDEFRQIIFTKGASFSYLSRVGSTINGDICGIKLDAPIVNLEEFNSDGERIFGVSGFILGSCIQRRPLEIAKGIILPDADIAITRFNGTSTAFIAPPISKVILN